MLSRPRPISLDGCTTRIAVFCRRTHISTHRPQFSLFASPVTRYGPFLPAFRPVRLSSSVSSSSPAAGATFSPSAAAKPAARASFPRTLTRFATVTALSLSLFCAGLAMSGGAEIVSTVNGTFKPPTDEETLTMFVPSTPKAEEVDQYIRNHPFAQKLRETLGMKEARPHMRIPEAMRPHNLTGGVLLGDGKIEVPPLIFADNEAELPSMYSISYLGKSLCGHPGIVHGGMLATLLDEGLARACFPALPNKVGVTASLKIDYRVPCPAGRYVVLKAFTTKVEGRKAWVKGWIELLGDDNEGDGIKLVEAEALFIEPKNAGLLAKFYAE